MHFFKSSVNLILREQCSSYSPILPQNFSEIWAQGVNPSKETEQKVLGVLGNERMRYDGFSKIYPKIAPK